MSVQTMTLPPIFVDGTEFHADPVRRMLSALVGDQRGFFGDAVFDYTINADSTITVQPGRAAVPALDSTVTGVFLVESTNAVTLPIAPPHATQDRVDALIAYAVPPIDANHTGTWVLEVRAGTPAVTPQAPPVGNALVLCEIRIPAEATGSAPTTTERRRATGQQYLGAVVYSGDTAPTTARAGSLWVDWNTGEVQSYEGSRWAAVGVTRYTSTTERDNEHSAILYGQLCVTTDTGTLWIYTRDGWQAIGNASRASHSMSGTASPSTSASSTVTNWSLARNGGLVSLQANGGVQLLRAGKWAITVRCFADWGGGEMNCQSVWHWPGGPFISDPRASGYTKGGFNAAGVSDIPLSWSGYVTPAMVANPFTVTAFMTSNVSGSAVFRYEMYLEYEGP